MTFSNFLAVTWLRYKTELKSVSLELEVHFEKIAHMKLLDIVNYTSD